MTNDELQEMVSQAVGGMLPGIGVWRELAEDDREMLLHFFHQGAYGGTPTDCYDRIERVCIMCSYWEIYPGWGGTDVTPGDSGYTRCNKQRWEELSLYDIDNRSYAEALLTARTCDDFSPSRVAIENLPEDEE